MDVIPPIIVCVVAIASLALNLIVTPIVRAVAIRSNFIDQPDQQRKLHRRAVALGGGLAVLLAMWAAVAMVLACSTPLRQLLLDRSESIFGLLIASCLIVLIGLLDDWRGIRGRHKLLGQFAASLVLVSFGFVIPGVTLFGIHIELGWMSIPITVGWLLLAINALNLIDGIDGLASTVGLILSATLACMAFLNGHPAEALLLAAMGGSIAGFLRFNFPPASIFLGDAGSMLIGMWLGAISIHAALKGPAVVGLAAPLAVWTVPFVDTFAAIIRRKLTGRSIYSTDRGHLHHCLQQISGSSRRTLYLIVMACSATCIGALTSVFTKSDMFALISAASVVGVLVATRAFGYGELQLLTGKLHSLVHQISPRFGRPVARPEQYVVRLQGSQHWEEIWSSMLNLCESYNLTKLLLDVNVPACHENFHVSWSRPSKGDPLPQWEVRFPLCVKDRVVGQILVAGLHDGFSACKLMEVFFEALHACEIQLQETVVNTLNDITAKASKASAELSDLEVVAG